MTRGYRGVMWSNGRWHAFVCVDGTYFDLGAFDTEAEADAAYVRIRSALEEFFTDAN